MIHKTERKLDSGQNTQGLQPVRTQHIKSASPQGEEKKLHNIIN